METKTATRKPYPGTFDFIKSYLLQEGSSYANKALRVFREKLREIGQRPPTYQSFARSWHILKELNLIEFVREEQVGRKFPRKYYRIVQKNVDSKDWQNPQTAWYIKNGWTWVDPVTGEVKATSQLGSHRYRTKVLGITPKKVGRPRKLP